MTPVALCLLCGLAAAAELRDGGRLQIYQASSGRPYEHVLDDVKFAITEHNFRITGGNAIGAAIAKRHGIVFPRSDIVHFCNLEYAHRLLRVDLEFLLQMPCKIALYEREDGHTVVAVPLVPETPRVAEPAREVNEILRAIVDYATQD